VSPEISLIFFLLLFFFSFLPLMVSLCIHCSSLFCI
jgi:hypothetical protein